MSEPRAPYGLPQPPASPAGPRNLTLPLAQWLRRLGFLVSEQGLPAAPVALEATWRALDGLLYQLSYAYAPAQGTGIFQLVAYQGHGAHHTDYRGLVHKAEVNRLKEARFLLLSNVFYKDARQAALTAGVLHPTHAS